MFDNNVTQKKSYQFAIRIVNAYKYLSKKQRENVLSKQLLRSGTAIGALVREGVHAQSRADFLNKMNIALKEAYETEYWISLLYDTEYLNEKNIFINSCRLCGVGKAFNEYSKNIKG